MIARLSVMALSAGVLLIPGACAGEAGVETARLPLKGAAPTDGYPAVVALVAAPQQCGERAQVVCTATLVAADVLLTAGHCVDLAPLEALQAHFGSRVDGEGERIAVRQWKRHPKYMGRHHDLALLRLARAPQLAPMPLRTRALEDWAADDTVTLVGYGLDDVGDTGLKRAGAASVEAFEPFEISFRPAPALTCNGDSGGPVVLARRGTQQVIGVVTGGDPACERTSRSARVDVDYNEFLAPTLAEWQQTPRTPRRPIDPKEQLCDFTCRADEDCPESMYCAGDVGASEAGSGRCQRAGLGAGQFVEVCEPGAPVPSDAWCLDDPQGACMIYKRCNGEPAGCAVGSSRRTHEGAAWTLVGVGMVLLRQAAPARTLRRRRRA